MSLNLDPDYRKKGWNKSKYKPKNRRGGSSISELAGGLSAMLIVVIYGGLYLLTDIQVFTIYGIGIGFVVWFVLYIIIALRIRGREWKRIQREWAKEELAKSAQPETPKTPRPLDELSPTQFEREIAWLFNTITPTKALVVGGAGDGGVDIELHQNGKLVGIVQCKRYDPTRMLQPDHVRAFYATKTQRGVNRAYLVTTARVSKATINEAKKLGIQVMDGNELNTHYQKAKSNVV